MRIRIAVPEEHVDPHVIDAALESVTRLDESLIRSGQSPTSHELIAAGARWRPENMGDEHFDHGGTLAARGWGDCDDWAPLHAATLRASGSDPGAIARVIPSGPSTYHAIVQRSSGAIEDPSVAAGMKPIQSAVIGGGEAIEVWACDPHDGRIYHGSLLPTVGPLSLHCGPQFSVRGCIVGGESLYEARCDLPMSGSPLIGAHHRARHRHRHHRHRVRGACIPYSLSSTAMGFSPSHALSDAICGAVMCGDAAELSTALDRYKLLAMQAKLSGMHPGHIQEALVDQILQDIHQEAAATGQHPVQFLGHLASELAAQGVHAQPNAPEIAAAISEMAHGTDIRRVVGMAA